MRKQYHLRPTAEGFDAWDVHRLVELTKDHPVINVRLDDIKELDQTYWYQSPEVKPTCRSIVDHMRLVQESDLNYPIILAADGGVMDGMHRVVKAALLDHDTIRAVQFEETPKPDFTNARENELPYD